VRAGLLAAVAVLAAAVAAGCSASPDLSDVAQAASKTEGASTVSFSMSVKISGEGLYTMEGGIDFAHDSGRFKAPAPANFTVIWNGSTTWIKFPEGKSVYGAKKPWLKVVNDTRFGSLSQFALLDPVRLFGLLKQAGRFSPEGNEDVRGVATTKYTGQVDAEKFAQLVGPDDAGDAPEGVTFPVAAWVDDDGYIRRVSLAVPATGDEAAGTLSIDLYSFGEPVDTSPPPADQVEDLKIPTGGTPSTATLSTYTSTGPAVATAIHVNTGG